MKIALCLLTLNEIEGCRHDVPLLDLKMFHEVYAVDGGSTDGTVEFFTNQNIPVYRQPVKGLNAAHIHAVERCSAEAIVFFHPKGSVPPADVLKFRPFFEQGYELIVASRMIKGGVNEEQHKFLRIRKWLVVLLAAFAALV